MPHLTLEELARLVDEAPLEAEQAHLRDCLVCRRELEGLREQTFTLAALDAPHPAPAAWHRLEAALRAEGLMRGAIPVVAPLPWWQRPGMLRLAAALALFALGGGTGAALWSRASTAGGSGTVQGTPLVVHPSPQRGAPMLASASEAPLAAPAAAQAQPVAEGSGARLVSTGGRPAASPPSAAVRRAQRDLAEAEVAYLAALQRYAAVADPASGNDPQTRLDALERMITTTRAALERAPADPLINGYHLAAVRERDALQRQLATADSDWF
jgi:hypothetical protein